MKTKNVNVRISEASERYLKENFTVVGTGARELLEAMPVLHGLTIKALKNKFTKPELEKIATTLEPFAKDATPFIISQSNVVASFFDKEKTLQKKINALQPAQCCFLLLQLKIVAQKHTANELQNKFVEYFK